MIEASALEKHYGQVRAVDGLSFTVEAGRVTGFLGANGAGKSTTLRMALGLDEPTAGTVTVGGRRYRDLPAPAREVGALLDPRAADPRHGARDHLRWMAAAASLPASRVDEVLEQVELTHVAARRVGALSLGMRQRLGIAGALLGDPGVLVLDEPLNGLDPAGIRWVRDLLHSLASEGRTVFLSSHLMSEVEQVARTVVVIAGGKGLGTYDVAALAARHHAVRVAPADPRDLLHLERVLRAPAGEDGRVVVQGMSTADVGRAALAAGIALRELGERSDRLEESFLELTGKEVHA